MIRDAKETDTFIATFRLYYQPEDENWIL